MQRILAVVIVVTTTLLGGLEVVGFPTLQAEGAAAVQRRQAATVTAPVYSFRRLTRPARTSVTDSAGRWVATFTDGARTVSLAGPSRRFSEPTTTTATVTSTTWVRVLRAPFAGVVDQTWLRQQAANRAPDVLAQSMQYLHGAPRVVDAQGWQTAGDASYGPLLASGSRGEGSDFNDYIGFGWAYGPSIDRPEGDQLGSLDCSGYVRMLFGYRNGVPMSLAPDGVGMPRRAVDIASSAPGVAVVGDAGTQSTAYAGLSPGDLVFFDVDPDDGPQIDHVGLYLGLDSTRHHRFVSSRKKANGPTLGDVGGASLLDGPGYYAAGFRAARRL